MKLMLRGYSQDVDFLNQTGPTDSYLVFENEETGQLIRLPVPWETIVELATMAGVGPSEEGEEPEVEDSPETEEPEESVEEQEARHKEELAKMRLERDGHDADELPPRVQKKRMPQPPAPHVYSSARGRLQSPATEDDVPSV